MTECNHISHNGNCSICRHALMHNAYHEMQKSFRPQLKYFPLKEEKTNEEHLPK